MSNPTVTPSAIPDDIYPTVQQPVPAPMCFNPFSNSGFGSNNIPFPTSEFSVQPPSGPAPRKRILIAESDFVIVLPFQGVVHGIRGDGINPEQGLPISTYLSRSPMTLEESVAHVALRFFSEEQILKMKEKSMPEVSDVTIEKNEPQLFAATDLKQPLLNSKNLWHCEGGKQVKEFIETNAIYNKHDLKPDCLPLMLPDGSTQAGKQMVLDILLKHIDKQEVASTEARKKRPPTATLPPRTAIPLTRAPDLEADKQRQYYHNHIVGACYVYLPQTAAHIRWGGKLRVANGYNTGHFRGTPIFHSLLIDLKDLPYYGVPEIASEAFDIPGAKAVLVVATGEGLVPRPFTMLSKEERYFLHLAKEARKAGTNKNTELAITVKPPHVGFHRPPSSVEEIPDSTAHGANLQPYGMPKGSYAFDILNTNSQPPMRFGCVAFVNRSRVFFIGGQLSYIDVEYPDTSALPPVVFELSKIQWEIKNSRHDLNHEVNRYVHASSCQSGRHSDSDEAVGYVWGGHNRVPLRPDTAGRTIPGGTTSTKEHANISIQSKFEANTKLTMVWFPQADGLTFRKDDDKSQFMITEVLKMNPKSAGPTPEPLDDEGRPVNYDTLAEQDLRKLQSFGLLVSNSRLQPPSYEQFKQMRENPSLRSVDAWDVLYLFHRNGQVWSLTLSSETVFNPEGLSWKLERHHWVLPFSLQSDDLKPERQKEIAAKTISDLDSVSLRIVGVVPRARFTHDLIPDDIYPTVQQPVPQMGFNPFSNSGFGNNNIPFPPSGFSVQPPSGPAPRKRMLIAESDFVIVFEKLLRDRTRQHTVVAQSTTFIPKLGHCVNEYYRVRMPRGVSLQAVTVVTPHFLRPLPPPQIMIPLSDSRRVDQSNVDRQTNRIRELPTVRPFQGVVHGIRGDGINPEHCLPISTYLSRSRMTLKESVAHVAMRFFSEKQLLKMKEKSMPEVSD